MPTEIRSFRIFNRLLILHQTKRSEFPPPLENSEDTARLPFVEVGFDPRLNSEGVMPKYCLQNIVK